MPYRLIIIDDEKEISSGFAQYFPWAQLGFKVTAQFSRAKEALDFVRENAVDVIVTDVIMPGMTGIEFAKELSLLKMDYRPSVVFFSAYDKFQYAQQALEYGGCQYILKSAGYDELVDIFSRLRRKLDACRPAGGADASGGDKVVSTIRRYVFEHPADASLEEASALVYLSPAYVSRYFKQKTGQNFADFLLEQRMQKAAGLLRDLQYKIYDISAMVGYSNPFNFTRSFKKHFGMTPKEYRFHVLGRILPEDEDEKK